MEIPTWCCDCARFAMVISLSSAFPALEPLLKFKLCFSVIQIRKMGILEPVIYMRSVAFSAWV